MSETINLRTRTIVVPPCRPTESANPTRWPPGCVVWDAELTRRNPGHLGRSITIELKSRRGQCSPSQRLAREALLRAGAQWWVCRSANAAMWALVESGVTFRVLSYDDGNTERWQQPKLPAWEVPKRNPHERRPRAPDYWEPDEAAEIAEPAAASDDAAGGDIAA